MKVKMLQCLACNVEFQTTFNNKTCSKICSKKHAFDRRREYNKKYYGDPDIKEKMHAYYQSPDVKAKTKALHQTSKYKKKAKEYRDGLKYKSKVKDLDKEIHDKKIIKLLISMDKNRFENPATITNEKSSRED